MLIVSASRRSYLAATPRAVRDVVSNASAPTTRRCSPLSLIALIRSASAACRVRAHRRLGSGARSRVTSTPLTRNVWNHLRLAAITPAPWAAAAAARAGSPALLDATFAARGSAIQAEKDTTKYPDRGSLLPPCPRTLGNRTLTVGFGVLVARGRLFALSSARANSGLIGPTEPATTVYQLSARAGNNRVRHVSLSDRTDQPAAASGNGPASARTFQHMELFSTRAAARQTCLSASMGEPRPDGCVYSQLSRARGSAPGPALALRSFELCGLGRSMTRGGAPCRPGSARLVELGPLPGPALSGVLSSTSRSPCRKPPRDRGVRA